MLSDTSTWRANERSKERARSWTLAAILIAFGCAGLVAAELVAAASRPADDAAVRKRTVISIASPMTLARIAKGQPLQTVDAPVQSYGCRSIVSLGEIRVGHHCMAGVITVADRD
jgi:hypothetical protein